MPVLPGPTTRIFKVNDLIKGAMRLIQAIGVGETPTAEEMSDCLNSLNSMISTWNNDQMMIYTVVSEVLTLIPGTATYTWGETGDIDADRPLNIRAAYLKILNNDPDLEIPLIVYSDDEFQSIAMKDFQSQWPQGVHNHGEFPLSTLQFYPVPTEANQVTFYADSKLSQFSLGDLVSLPDGYEEALRFNLAIRVAPEFGKSASAEVVAIANESKNLIKRTNLAPPPAMTCDIGGENGDFYVDRVGFQSGGMN